MWLANKMRKPHIREKSCSWDTSQNVLGQSDCRILKTAISWERNSQFTWFFACRYKFRKGNGELSFYLKIETKNGCAQNRRAQLFLENESVNELDFLHVCRHKFRKENGRLNLIWKLIPKKGVVSWIPRFLKCLYLENKTLNKLGLLWVDTSLGKKVDNWKLIWKFWLKMGMVNDIPAFLKQLYLMNQK